MKMLAIDAQIKSNTVVRGKVNHSKMTVNPAVLKQHLPEIITIFIAMQQKKNYDESMAGISGR